MTNSTFQGHFYVFIATVLIGGAFIAVENLAGLIDPFSLILLRFLASAIILAPFILLKKEYRQAIFKTLSRGVILSFFYAGFFVLQLVALETTTALNTGALHTLTPLITAILSIAFFKDSISFKQFAIFFLAAISTCGVIFQGSFEMFLRFSLNKGDYIFFASMFLMAFYSIFLKTFQKDEKAIVMVFSILLGGSVWMSLIILIFDIPLNWHLVKGEFAFNIAYLVVLTTLFTLYLYQKATAILNPKIIMSYTYINPAVVAILVSLMYDVKLDLKVWFFIAISCFITVILQLVLHKEKQH